MARGKSEEKDWNNLIGGKPTAKELEIWPQRKSNKHS